MSFSVLEETKRLKRLNAVDLRREALELGLGVGKVRKATTCDELRLMILEKKIAVVIGT